MILLRLRRSSPAFSNGTAIDRRQGSTIVLIAIFVVALIAFAALSVDVGNVLVQRRKISEAADAAALAAVVDWATNAPSARVQTVGQQYGVANGLLSAELVGTDLGVDPGTWNDSTKTFSVQTSLPSPMPANQVAAVRVRARRVVPMSFGRVVGLSAMEPRVESIAVAAAGQCVRDVLPVGVCLGPGVINECDTVVLHFTDLSATTSNSCGGTASSPNFGALDFACAGGGTDLWRDQMVTGYPNELCLGQCVCTKTGNLGINPYKALQDRLAGLPPFVCTAGAAAPENARTAVVPVVDTLTGSGNTCSAHITGFLVVALDNPIQSGGQITVTATFVRALTGVGTVPGKNCGPGIVCSIGLVK